MSRAKLSTYKSNAALPGVASSPRMVTFKLSASILARTESRAIAVCDRIVVAVSAEPVNDRTSNGVSASNKPVELPQTIDSAPLGSTPALMTSLTMRWVSHAVTVAGLMTTGTPESRAGAAFSHKPQPGKLKALIKSASPLIGTITCCD